MPMDLYSVTKKKIIQDFLSKISPDTWYESNLESLGIIDNT